MTCTESPATFVQRLASIGALLLCCGLAVAAPAVAQDNAPAPPTSLADYRFVNAFVVLDPDNPLFGMHEFYLNRAGLDAFRRGGPYPEGTEFVGMVYVPEQSEGTVNEGAAKAIVLMRKAAGAEDTGGWRFAMVGADGARMDIDPVKDCFECHTQVEARDYVFSEPRAIGDLESVPGP
jgi:hypothetical protein